MFTRASIPFFEMPSKRVEEKDMLDNVPLDYIKQIGVGFMDSRKNL
jgi:hypothetical protein